MAALVRSSHAREKAAPKDASAGQIGVNERAKALPVPSVTVATEILQALLEHLLVAAEREVELSAELFELCMLQVFAVRKKEQVTAHIESDPV